MARPLHSTARMAPCLVLYPSCDLSHKDLDDALEVAIRGSFGRQNVVVSVLEQYEPWWADATSRLRADQVVRQPLDRGPAIAVLAGLARVLVQARSQRVVIAPIRAARSLPSLDVIPSAPYVVIETPDGLVVAGGLRGVLAHFRRALPSIAPPILQSAGQPDALDELLPLQPWVDLERVFGRGEARREGEDATLRPVVPRSLLTGVRG